MTGEPNGQMETFVSIVLTLVTALLAIAVVIFLVEVIAAMALPRRQAGTDKSGRPHITVLVPAHNESSGLIATLADIKAQLRAGDKLLVVADNCTDDTAAVAAAHGAQVIERHDAARRGKGYALDFGLRHLASQPPEIVILLDADCRLADNAIDELAATCASTRRPVQALYLMSASAESQVNQRVAEFAWRVKNWLRPQGLMVLGLPCQLMGTGMAFPWDVIRSANLASGELVEDMKLGLDLAANGHPAVFCPSARVTSEFAASAKAAGTQRERWEQGHLGMIATMVPSLLGKAITRADLKLLALALDLAVPPLSLLAMLVAGMFVVGLLWALFGYSAVPLAVNAATLAAFVLAAVLAWLKCGRDVVPASAIFSIAGYALGKLGLYRAIVTRNTDTRWVRTDRKKSD